MASQLPTGTVTFLFTDIEGSTTLLKALGSERYHEVLAEHQRLLRAAVGGAGGREIDTQGDSFFFAFQRAKDAVAAAVEAQRALSSPSAWPDGVAVRVRVGLDSGEPTVGSDRYVGLGVHRTARIMAAGHGGQVLVSSTTRDLAADDLPTEITFRELGEQRLKDLDRPVRLYQVSAPGLPDTFPPLRTLDSEREAHRRPRRRRGIVIAVAALVVAAGAAAGVLATRSGGGRGAIVPPNSVGVIDSKTGRIVGRIAVGSRPGGIAAVGGSVWVANEQDRTLSRIDARTRAVSRTIPLDATPTGVAVGERAVWVAEGAAGSVARIDPQYNEVAKTIESLAGVVRVSGGPRGSVAVGAGSVWVAFGNSTVARLDPVSGRVLATGYAGFGASAIAYGEGALWVANATANTVSRFSPATSRKIADISVGRSPAGVAAGAGAVWVADEEDDAVSRVDPRSSSSTTIPVGSGPAGVAYNDGAIWVANSGDGTVSHIDAKTGKVVAKVEVGNRPVAIAAYHGFVWVTVEAP